LFWGVLNQRPFLGDERKTSGRVSVSQFDPTETSGSFLCCGSEAGFSPYQCARLNRYDAVT
jgi:hypothetical protein